MTDRVERLLNLTATLLDARVPLSLDEIASRLEPTYPEDKAARRRAFERDKETLRELGIPIVVESIDPLGGEPGYRVRPEDYYLADPGLTTDERAALHVAITAVRSEGDAARIGLMKLGGAEGVGTEPVAALGSIPELADLFDAVAKRRIVEFDYRGERRCLEPHGVVHRFGHWYIVGRDRDREAARAFRADRMEGLRSGEPNGFASVPESDPAEYVRGDPLTYGDAQPVDALVLVDAARAAWVVEELGEAAVVERRPDGSVVVSLAVVNRDAFRTWVLDLLEHAEVLAPPGFRSDMVEWLRALADGAP